MKRMLGMGAAAVLVLLQLAVLAAIGEEPSIYLAPADAQVTDARPA